MPRDAGFSDVRKLLGDRGIASLHWSRGDGDDGPAAARVRELLSRDLTVDTATEVALLANPRL